jgi:hypothetical protein
MQAKRVVRFILGKSASLTIDDNLDGDLKVKNFSADFRAEVGSPLPPRSCGVPQSACRVMSNA